MIRASGLTVRRGTKVLLDQTEFVVHPGERVDERGLADVGTAGEGDLDARRLRQLLELCNTQEETRRAAEKTAARIDLVFAEAGGQLAAFFLRKGRLLRMLPKKSISTPCRFMM